MFRHLLLLIVAALSLSISNDSNERLTILKSNIYTKSILANVADANPYSTISPLPIPRWDLSEPIKLRNFKAPYHLTMGLQSCTLSELLVMDKTYGAKIELRRRIIETNEQDVVACNSVAREAVAELYEWIFGTYLPRRFPETFIIKHSGYHSSHSEKGNDAVLHNTITSDLIPLTAPSDPIAALKTLGAHVDAEFAILLPVSNPNAPPPPRIMPTDTPLTPYYLHAFVLCFPSGFNTPKKLGMKLAHIHAPVPGYSAKLEKSMDRYFASLPFGKVVRRQNWSVQSGEQLFVLEGNHLSTTGRKGTGDGEGAGEVEMAPPGYEASEEQVKEWERQGEDVKPEECRLRCERQTLHRLEHTGALVFAFKTYLYGLDEVVEEGSSEDMVDAVEGLRMGSVPGVEVYKRAVVWKKRVVEYLKSRHGEWLRREERLRDT